MRTFIITYRDTDPGCPEFTWRCRAYNAEHALDLFHDDGDDWAVIRVEAIS